jgi:hypothetical protein
MNPALRQAQEQAMKEVSKQKDRRSKRPLTIFELNNA